MLTIDKLQVTFGETQALAISQEITFNEGDRIGIIGSNGAGKSTLIKTLLGLVPYAGSIHTNLSTDDMAVHLQTNNYINTVSVKTIMESVLNMKISENAQLKELVEFFNFEPCLKKKFKQLSGGQQQRLTIILVLMQNKPLTFFDEVTSGLDFETRQQLMSKINDWYRDSTATVCIVSHYYDELETLTNKLLLLEKGQVVAFGGKDELFTKYCGYSTIIIDNTPEHQAIFTAFDRLEAPEHLLAFACKNLDEEAAVVDVCIRHNVNFKRSNNDIEIMTMNAKKKEGFLDETK